MKTTYIVAATLIAVIALGLAPKASNADPTYPRPHEVNKRLANQNARIKQGVKSGQLTRRETRNLRLRDASIHYQEQRDRIRDNGHLTKREDVHLNRELNHTSNAIYRDKHNNWKR
jgi:hypothetical protein